MSSSNESTCADRSFCSSCDECGGAQAMGVKHPVVRTVFLHDHKTLSTPDEDLAKQVRPSDIQTWICWFARATTCVRAGSALLF